MPTGVTPIRVAYLTFPPYLDAVQRNGQTILTGIVGNLMMHIIQALKLNCTFVKPADGRYGVLQNGTWSGKIGMLVRNEADISPGPFIMTSSRVSAAHPSFPWAYEDIVIFAGRPFQFSKNVFGFLSAFSGLVWFVIAVTLLATWAAYVACLAGAPRPSRLGRLRAVRRRAEASSAFGLFVRTILSQGKISKVVIRYFSKRSKIITFFL
ncbi:probable glutamate receptor [Ixodes scapularis]|uniref:probable glutamate receptor n=1 Tax=Ixodes scapularis TaxID=6945 RepID=UPI001A9E9E1D|nr:probable glutamate receptor [Ixodes scapularis]